MQNKVACMMSLFPMILLRCAGLPYPFGNPVLSPENQQESRENEAFARLLAAFDDLLNSLPVSPLRLQVYNARKAFYQRKKSPGKALLQPLEPLKGQPAAAHFFQCFAEWDTLSKGALSRQNAREIWLQAEYKQVLRAAREEPFQRALLFASHDLLEAIAGIDPASEKFGKKERQALLSACQYLTRGALKTSPFSRFTTVGLLDLRHETPALPAGMSTRAWITPNVALLPAFYACFLQQPAFYRQLSLHLNPSLRQHAEHLEWLYFDGEREAFQSVAIQPAIRLVMQAFASRRELPFMELQLLLQEQVDASAEKLEDFIRELTDFGLLSWNLPETGASADWLSNLIRYLSHLPAADVFSEWIFMLQQIRATARALPFKTVAEALRDMQSLQHSLNELFEKHHQPAPALPASRLFFEDVEALPENISIIPKELENWTTDLQNCLKNCPPGPVPEFRTQLATRAEQLLAPGENMNFLDFCRAFFEHPPQTETRRSAPDCPVVGALLMPFEENGKKRAVVNALYPGGGKLFARWLHLFPEHARSTLEAWQGDELMLFPWQGWSNANFQPFTRKNTLAVPDGKFNGSDKALLLSELQVKRTATGPVLTDGGGKRLLFTDLGLEAPEWRPPVMQLLWHLGVPYISTAFFPEGEKQALEDGVIFTERIEYQSLVLRRSKWLIPPEAWHAVLAARSGAVFFDRIGEQFRAWQIPRQIFVRPLADREKPQFIDLHSPLSVLLLEKMMRKHEGALFQVEEMLPLPEQWITGAALEITVEFRTSS